MRRWVLFAAGRSAAVITVSRALADRLRDIGVSPEKLSVLPNGVDLEKFRPLEAESGTIGRAGGLHVLSVGHLVEDKGHHRVIEAIAAIPEARLSIVGQGPWERRLRSLADRLDVTGRVDFRGYVPHDEMAAVYSAADLTVLASAREGMPNVVLESLACGTRVIATDVGGVSEVLTAPQAGLVIAPDSSAAVLEGLRQMAASPDDRRATRQFAEEHLSWDSVVTQQRQLYQRVAVAAHASPRRAEAKSL